MTTLLLCDRSPDDQRILDALGNVGLSGAETVTSWPDLEAALITATMLADRVVLVLDGTTLLSGGIEQLLAVDDLLKPLGPAAVPVVVLQDSERQESASIAQFTVIRRFAIDAGGLEQELRKVLTDVLPAQPAQPEPEPPARRAAIATPPPAIATPPPAMAETNPPVVNPSRSAERPVGRDKHDKSEFDSAEQSVETELIELAVAGSGSLDELPLGRLYYELDQIGWAGRVTINRGTQTLASAVRNGEIGCEDGETRAANLRMAFAWTGATYHLTNGLDPSRTFTAFGTVNEMLHAGITSIPVNDAASMMSSVLASFATQTHWMAVRAAELRRYRGLAVLCEACDGTRTFEQIVASVQLPPEDTMKLALFARQTDLIRFFESTRPAPLIVQYRSSGVSGASSRLKKRRTTIDKKVDFTETIQKLEQEQQALETDPYGFFGIEKGCGRKGVKKAYLAKVKTHHPDAFGGNVDARVKELSETLFIRIKEVYSQLGKEERALARGGAVPSEPAISAADSLATTSGSTHSARVVPSKPPTALSSPSASQKSGSTLRPVRQRRTSTTGESSKSSTSSGGRPRPAKRVTPPPVIKPKSQPEPESAEPPKAESAERPSPADDNPYRQRKRRPLPKIRRPRQRNQSTSSTNLRATTPARKPKEPEREPTAEDHFGRAEKLLKAGKVADALEAATLANEMEADNGQFHAFHAYVTYLNDNKKRDWAKRELDNATKMELGGRPTGLLYLGKIAKLEGNDAEAFEYFKQVLEVAPRNAEARSEARLYQLRRKNERAKGKDQGLLGRFFKK